MHLISQLTRHDPSFRQTSPDDANIALFIKSFLPTFKHNYCTLFSTMTFSESKAVGRKVLLDIVINLFVHISFVQFRDCRNEAYRSVVFSESFLME